MRKIGIINKYVSVKKYKVSLLFDEVMIVYLRMEYLYQYYLYVDKNVEFSDELLFFKEVLEYKIERFVKNINHYKFYVNLTPFTDRRIQFQDLGDFLSNNNIVFNTESCPCCGFLTLESKAILELCDICYWEDDGQDNHNADFLIGGPNLSYTLSESRANFENDGTMYDRDKDKESFWLHTRKNNFKINLIKEFYEVLSNPKKFNQDYFHKLKSKIKELNKNEFKLNKEEKVDIDFTYKELLLFKIVVKLIVSKKFSKSDLLDNLELVLSKEVEKYS